MKLELDKINRNRLYQALGITLTAVSSDAASSELRASDAASWPQRDQPHGGVVFTQMDTTMATAALGAEQVSDCSTVSLQIQYLAPARGAVLTCKATVERRGGRICFIRGETCDPEGQVVAMAQGSFRTFSK
jgi:uncharacterized protein (TIGR00369 family)